MTRAEEVAKFLRSYLDMPRDADVEIGTGYMADAPKVLLVFVKISHPDKPPADVVLTPRDARKLADFAEDAIWRFPDVDCGLSNLVLGLRAAADAEVVG